MGEGTDLQACRHLLACTTGILLTVNKIKRICQRMRSWSYFAGYVQDKMVLLLMCHSLNFLFLSLKHRLQHLSCSSLFVVKEDKLKEICFNEEITNTGQQTPLRSLIGLEIIA